MDKGLLKRFAIESRQDLMEKMKNKIKTFYIDEDFKKEQKGELYTISNDKHTLNLSKEEYDKRELLIKRIKELSLEQVIEESAYTWFNRIIAIRYMEIHDFLPLSKDNQSLGIRVLSSKDNTPDPEIMKFSNLNNQDLYIGFKKEKYIELKDDNEKFKYILLLICKKLGQVIPQVFDGNTDYIDILIPDNLLNDTGFVVKLINEIPEENFSEVEIIGWLYQYYNQTEKDRVMSENRAYKKNEIAYVTQLFTPDWIVKYLVENTLVRYVSKNISQKTLNEFKYYDNKIAFKNNNLNISEISFIDPCCGSGHILVYAFEVFYKIYQDYGYNKNEIPTLILENNLYGLDIDDRAGQLSVLAILLKAREYDKNIFGKDIAKNINIMSVQESNGVSNGLIENITSENAKEIAKKIVNNFYNAKEIGSLIKINKEEYEVLEEYIKQDETIFGIELNSKIKPLIKVAKILSKKYDIYVTNPPYMNNNGMTNYIKEYLKKYYKDSKTDLYACFMNLQILKTGGLMGMINQHGWMFLSSFEQIRKKIINNYSILTMCHLGPRAFEEIGGEVVQTTAFVIENAVNNGIGSYYRLIDFTNPIEKENQYLKMLNNEDSKYHYMFEKNNFCKIPGEPIAYWVNNIIYNAFEKFTPLNKLVSMFQGIITGDNNKFLRLWWEVNNDRIALDKNKFDFDISKQCWIPYNKGGSFRKWYGNQEYVVDWKNGPNDKTRGKAGFGEFYLNEYISWSYITTSTLATRYFPTGFLWDVAGSGIFCNTDDLKYYQALIGSSMGIEILKIINPTMNYQVENVALLPIPNATDIQKSSIIKFVEENIELAKYDWDSKEISWKFKELPFTKKGLIKENILQYQNIVEKNKQNLFENERKINEIVYELYEQKDYSDSNYEITYSDCTTKTLIKELISYAVGCMFGRYSLDEDGLIYAGGEFDINKYKTFKVDLDNIIPITDESYFSDDIVERFKTFVKTVYGDNTFNENMDFIAETLGKKGTETSEETLRRYFVNDFFNDHCKIYQKRPIYWLLDSGKKNGFKALVYMHRYNENLIPKARLDYLHRVQTTYEKLLSDVNYRLTTELSMTDKKEAKNKQTDLMAKLQEIKEYDEKIAHIANQRIDIDLDDGVKINYEKFKDILAKIK